MTSEGTLTPYVAELQVARSKDEQQRAVETAVSTATAAATAAAMATRNLKCLPVAAPVRP